MDDGYRHDFLFSPTLERRTEKQEAELAHAQNFSWRVATEQFVSHPRFFINLRFRSACGNLGNPGGHHNDRVIES